MNTDVDIDVSIKISMDLQIYETNSSCARTNMWFNMYQYTCTKVVHAGHQPQCSDHGWCKNIRTASIGQPTRSRLYLSLLHVSAESMKHKGMLNGFEGNIKCIQCFHT
jgi:hypothetical protein